MTTPSAGLMTLDPRSLWEVRDMLVAISEHANHDPMTMRYGPCPDTYERAKKRLHLIGLMADATVKIIDGKHESI